MKKWVAIWVSVCGVILSAQATPRIFTDAKGRMIEAELLGFEKASGTVTIQRVGAKKPVSVPLDTFTKEDQIFVRKWGKKNPTYNPTQVSKLSASEHRVSLVVRDKVKKEREKWEEEPIKKEWKGPSTGNDYAAMVTYKGEANRETQTLEITMSNGTENPGEFTLEWYFFMQPEQNKWTEKWYKGDRDFDEILLYEKGKKTLSLSGRQKASHTITAKPLSLTTYRSEYDYLGNYSGVNTSNNEELLRGDTVEGYVVLLKYKDQVIAKDSNSKKLLAPEYLSLPVSKQTKPPRKRRD